MHDQLRPVLTLSDGIPYFKDNFFEQRLYKFALRGGLILILLVAAYIPALIGDVLWVDEIETTHGLLLRSTVGLAQLWRHPFIQPAYQPIAETILWLEYRIWGDSAIGFHSVSIALHMSTCMLLWFALRRLNVPGAWLAAAVFALHPMQVQAVAWVGAQPMLIGTFFYAVSLMLYLRFAQIEPAENLDPSIKLSEEWYESHPEAPAVPIALGSMPRTCYVFSLALFFFAALSEMTSWSLPIILVLILWWRGGHVTRRDIKSLIPYMVIGGLAFLFGIAQPEVYASRAGIAPDLSIVGRLLLPGQILFYYILKLLVPFPLSFSGPQWTVNAAAWWMYLFLGGLIAGLTVLWRERKRIGKGPLIALIFFLLSIFPFLGLTRFGWMRYSFVGDYLQYRASIGLIALGIAGLMTWCACAKSKDAEQLFRYICAVVLLTPLGGLFLWQAFSYQSSTTLWSADLDVDSHSEVAHRQLAWSYLQDSKPDKAVKVLAEAVKYNPKSGSLWVLEGEANFASGFLMAAVKDFREALIIDPRNTKALSDLSDVKAKQGKILEAIDAYLQVLAIDSHDAKAHAAVADLYGRQNELDKAIAHQREAVRIDYNWPPYHLSLARMYFELKQLKEAAEELQIAAKIDPNNYDTYMTAGEMLSRLHEFGLAEHMFGDATRVRPKSFEAWNNLGVALVAQRRPKEAIYALNQALKLNPYYDPSRKNLETALESEIQANQLVPLPTTPPPPLPASTAPSTIAHAKITRPATEPATAARPVTTPAGGNASGK